MVSKQPVDTYQNVEELSRIEGVVLYRAWDPAGKRPVLLQRFLNPLPHEDILADLHWTGKPLATLEREDVRAITGWGLNSDQQLCLVVEPVSGRPLSTQMAEMAAAGRQYEPRQALRLILGLASILQAALQVGIVHKALHPQQVMLPESDLANPENRPVLLNLDLPALAAVMTGSRYQPWEQQHGRAIDGRSNIYSLGVLLYDLLAGLAPDAATPRAPLEEVRPGLPAPVYEVVNRATRSVMLSRYQTWEEFIAALGEALAALGAPAGFAGSAVSHELAPLPPEKPNRLPYGLAALTMLLLAILVVLAFFEEAQLQPVTAPLRNLFVSQEGSRPAGAAPIPTWPFDFNNFIVHDTATPTATAVPTDPSPATSTIVSVATVVATSTATPVPPTPTPEATAVPPTAPPSPTAIPPTPVPASPTPPPPPTAVPPTAPPPPPPPPTSVPPTAPPPPPPPTATPPPPPAPSATAPLPGG